MKKKTQTAPSLFNVDDLESVHTVKKDVSAKIKVNDSIKEYFDYLKLGINHDWEHFQDYIASLKMPPKL